MLSLLALLLLGSTIRAQDERRAALVVRFGDGSVATACVPFAEDEISGAELLRRAGWDVIVDPHSGFGEAICKIDDGAHADGCDYPADECFCQCQGADCIYWAYYHLQDGHWVYSDAGPSHWLVHDGDVEGWAWSSGSPQGGDVNAEPPVMSFAEICEKGEGAASASSSPAASLPARGDWLQWGGFALVLLLIVIAGAWAWRRQAE